MHLAIDDEVRYRHCETCEVEWVGQMTCWWCGDLTPPLPENDWLADIWTEHTA